MIDTAPSYTRRIFHPDESRDVVEWIAACARREHVDALAGCGHSGLVPGAIAAYLARIPFIAVRKSGENAHSSARVHAVVASDTLRYAFVDDMIATGETLKRVVNGVEGVASNARLVAVILYTCAVSSHDLVRYLGERYTEVARYMFQARGAL